MSLWKVRTLLLVNQELIIHISLYQSTSVCISYSFPFYNHLLFHLSYKLVQRESIREHSYRPYESNFLVYAQNVLRRNRCNCFYPVQLMQSGNRG